MEPELTEPDIFVLLAKRERRLLLEALWRSTPPLTTVELANRIAERTYERPSSEQQRDVYLELYHNHLPRLEEADVIVYDEKDGRVAPDRNFDRLLRFVEEANEQRLSWSDE